MTKKIIKWTAISLASLLVLAVAFTAVFIVLPLSRSIKNLQEKKDEPQTTVQTETAPAVTAPPAETQPAVPEQTTAASEPAFTEFDIYRSGKFYVKGTVTDKDGQTNPMEMAITDDSVYMLTAASGVQMGVMIGGGKTYLVSPENRAYIELSEAVLSMLGMDASKLAAPSSFNFSDMQPLSEADEVIETELNGVKCTEYTFHAANGRKTAVYMAGERLLQTDMINADGSLYNRMTFETVTAEIPPDRLAPPTYYEKKGLLGFISLVSKNLSE